MRVLKTEDMPQPGMPSAYMDNNKRIWLWEPDPPSTSGRWRAPGGLICKPGNMVLDAVLAKMKVTRLRRMAPVRSKTVA